MKKFLNEFRQFALKGNVMSVAVGVIIGGAFQGVVTSLTGNILSPFIGLFTGLSFESWSVNLFGVEITYGAFVTSLVNFIILALTVFLLVKLMNRLLPEKKAEPPAPRKCPYCLSGIEAGATRCPMCTSQL